MNDEKKKRYPGVKFFEEYQSNIYFGREKEKEDVYSLIMTNKTLVLHGESGNGKSSLVRAGLIPLIKEKNPEYLPIVINLGLISDKDSIHKAKCEELLIEYSINMIEKEKNSVNDSISYLTEKKNDFWYTAKLFDKQEKSLLLIFDQFEEFQQFTSKQQEIFAKKLSELLSSIIPQYIHAEIFKTTENFFVDNKILPEKKEEYNNNMQFLKQPVRAKVIFAIREDKLGTMSLLGNYFQDILRSEYNLRALEDKSAFNAISKPAKVDGEFYSPKFEFEESAINFIIKKFKDDRTGLIDPFQLQIVCNDIEERVKACEFEKNGNKIKKEEVGKIQDIINNFYNKVWDKVQIHLTLSEKLKWKFENKRKVILEKFVIKGKRRIVIREDLVKGDDSEVANIVDTLTKEGLIRKIPSGTDEYYQLSHDKLIEPLIEDIKQFEVNEKRRRILIRIIVITVIFSTGIFYLYNKKVDAIHKTLEEFAIKDAFFRIQRAYFLAGELNRYGDQYADIENKPADPIACNRFDSAIVIFQQNDSIYTKYSDKITDRSLIQRYDSLHNELSRKLRNCHQVNIRLQKFQ